MLLNGKRVLVVMGHGELGGAERQALVLATHLARDYGALVEVWLASDRGVRVPSICDEHGLPWRRVPAELVWNQWQLVRQIVHFGEAMRKARPDIVLPSTHIPNVLCGLSWRWAGARACLWNQRDEGNITRLERRVERLACRQASFATANSQGGADFLAGRMGIPADRIRVIHNGVELAPPQTPAAEWRRRLNIPEHAFVACMIGSLSMFKDHETLLRAWAVAFKAAGMRTANGASPVLLLAGKFFTTVEPLKALAFDLELGTSVKFLGEVDDVSGLLGAADLGVFSSRMEGCPNGVLECMAAGLPIAGTDIPGIREAVGEAQYAHLAPAGAADDLAKRILQLAANADERRRLGALNRTRIETHFSARGMVASTVDAILQAMARRSDRRDYSRRPA